MKLLFGKKKKVSTKKKTPNAAEILSKGKRILASLEKQEKRLQADITHLHSQTKIMKKKVKSLKSWDGIVKNLDNGQHGIMVRNVKNGQHKFVKL